jgi:hypothetical protein
MRYAQNVRRVLQIPGESVFLLAMLMLRGPQTAAELRTNCSRLCRFSDVSAVEGFLAELAARSSGALVQELPRQAGSRETRWVHLLCGAAALRFQRKASSRTPTFRSISPRSWRRSGAPSRATRGRGQAGTRERSNVFSGSRRRRSNSITGRHGSASRRSRATGHRRSSTSRWHWVSPTSPPATAVRRQGAGAGTGQRAQDPVRVSEGAAAEAPVLRRRHVTTFGRDFASTSIQLSGSGPAAVRWESQVWVRLPEGWRVVAAHASEVPPPSR